MDETIESEPSKIDTIKNWAIEHEEFLKGLGLGLCVGIGFGFGAGYIAAPKQISVIAQYKPVASAPEVIQQLIRRGHPGNIIKCVETGEVFASQNRAADALGVSKTALGKHLKGFADSANGYHFELIGEMPSAPIPAA